MKNNYWIKDDTRKEIVEKPSRASPFGGFFLRHVFAVAETLRVPLPQPQKCRIPICVIRHGD